MSSGIFIECDNCGAIQQSYRIRNVKKFRKYLADISIEYMGTDRFLSKWMSSTVAGKGVRDFCCKECYEEFKNQSK